MIYGSRPRPGNFAVSDERGAESRRLPADFKEVVLLHYYQNFGIAEIATMLDIPEGTVSSRLNRARKKLSETLKGEEA